MACVSGFCRELQLVELNIAYHGLRFVLESKLSYGLWYFYFVHREKTDERNLTVLPRDQLVVSIGAAAADHRLNLCTRMFCVYWPTLVTERSMCRDIVNCILRVRNENDGPKHYQTKYNQHGRYAARVCS